MDREILGASLGEEHHSNRRGLISPLGCPLGTVVVGGSVVPLGEYTWPTRLTAVLRPFLPPGLRHSAQSIQ